MPIRGHLGSLDFKFAANRRRDSKKRPEKRTAGEYSFITRLRTLLSEIRLPPNTLIAPGFHREGEKLPKRVTLACDSVRQVQSDAWSGH